jgi:hypothetical protein
MVVCQTSNTAGDRATTIYHGGGRGGTFQGGQMSIAFIIKLFKRNQRFAYAVVVKYELV